MKVQNFVCNALQENTYILWDITKQCVIIDAGCYDKEEQDEIVQFIESQQLVPQMLLSTHSHIDHVLGNYYLKKKFNVPLYIYPKDEPTLIAVKTYAPMYGFPLYQEQTPDGFIDTTKDIMFGNTKLKVLFVPGHAPGHIAFLHMETKSCFSGDVLFAGSIGRTDLPGGSMQTLMNSIENVIIPLGDDTRIYPGHGPITTVGREKMFNPFLKSI